MLKFKICKFLGQYLYKQLLSIFIILILSLNCTKSKEEPIIAYVNNQPFLLIQFREYYKHIIAKGGSGYNSTSAKQMLLEQLIGEKLLASKVLEFSPIMQSELNHIEQTVIFNHYIEEYISSQITISEIEIKQYLNITDEPSNIARRGAEKALRKGKTYNLLEGKIKLLKATTDIQILITELDLESVSDTLLLAKVNGQSIYLNDLLVSKNDFIEIPIDLYSNPNLWLELLIGRLLIIEEAKSIDLVNNIDITYEIQREKNHYLAEYYLTEQIRNEFIENPLMLENHFNRYYDQFYQSEEVRVRHILIKDRKRAEEILKQLKDGADFAKLASTNSQCPSADYGGDLGWFKYGKMEGNFTDTAFELEKNEISGIVITPYGFHIIQKLDHHPRHRPIFKEMKEEIITHYLNIHFKIRFDEIIKQIIRDTKISIDEEQLAIIR